MVNFRLLAGEIVSLVWGTPANFNGFRVLAALLHGTLVAGVSQTAAFNRGRHLYSAGRPSGWALAHILVSYETWSLSTCDEKRVDVAWNNAFRKIFNAYWHESVKTLLLSSCVHLVTHEETVILEENAM